MPIFRVHKNKTHPYTVIDNTSVNDKRLSAKAKGLLLFLISKPDHWFVNLHNLVSSFSDGESSIRSGIKELIKFGYIFRSHIRSNNGRYIYYDYFVFEQPIKLKSTKTTLPPECGFPVLDNPILDNRTLVSTDKNKVLKTTTTPSSANSKLPAHAADETAALNKKKETILLFEKLNIRNFKKIFKEFPLDKIFDYATWIINRNSKMSNPTGFIISAMRENWIDYDKTPEVKKIPRWWIYCFPCRKNYNYQSISKIQYTCPICKKLIPFSEHERF